MKAKTKLIHGIHIGDPLTGAVTVPIYQTSTYKQEAIGKHKGYEYSRTGNPTRNALEDMMAVIENGHAGFAFGSGMAAITAVMMLFSSGDHVVLTDDVYGGTYRVMSKVLNRFGIEHTFVDTTNLAEVEAAIRPNTKAIYIETPTNPLLKVTDIGEVSALAKAHNLLTIVDNTFMTPYWQTPISLGADIVLHSATKYLGGHSDVVAGVVVVNSEELAQDLHFVQNSTGGVLGPQDSWLLLRGLKTLGVRMQEHEANAHAIVKFLQNHPKVTKVYYPGIENHPNHDVAKKQAEGFGAIVSFDVDSEETLTNLMERLQYFTLAESLGAVESLISVPSKMTHASIPADRRAELGITDTLIRISIGIEDGEDLIEDLTQALS
ncbi:bifunctional cystathionine gamma-lyase/homocysteine desulfhydrase [Ectobacillus antri]|jgi:cystathionine gamma-lyase/homocysteine desulfhydrase|uniref:Bifunctional cystathionine gamma-lyase/homocysteine desulfhydrase n=1 Tax=Ectobacillus antri TaxID=2486280 RepID=A0ABT6H1B7_9BACI|nr:bifunctional cystathionine gamma-lyase/homocysteine desulfhydrase [Ectobacillus antri]MDG4655436.1 bifunctional cystathionine gamma-lyase/homocysteine desulfhydrase [Ectobacillus antri]MDG5753194.1 bifunctional cystathionine gamma-lyase/homocysteine desulfhydrase [Ectobacillus antri]